MRFVTDFADQAVVLPVAVLVAAWLAVCGWWRGLAAWAFGVVGMMGSMALLKYLCFACAGPLAWSGVHSPSGHTAASGTIYGGALLLLLRDRVPRAALLAIPPALVLLFGVSRLAVQAHDWQEVAVGAAIGLTGAAAIVLLAGPRPALHGRVLGVVALGVILVFHGVRLQAEATIHRSTLFTWIPLPQSCRG